jgi:outer membrane protein
LLDAARERIQVCGAVRRQDRRLAGNSSHLCLETPVPWALLPIDPDKSEEKSPLIMRAFDAYQHRFVEVAQTALTIKPHEKANLEMKTKILLPLLAAATLSVPALAQEGTYMMRVRALNMQVDNGNSPNVAGAKVEVNNKTFPEIDFVYNFTNNIAAELVLTYPQKHDVKLQGNKIGTLKHLPPTLTLQYYFSPGAAFNPYVGAGVNYTRFMSVSLPTGITVDNSSFGFAAQVGADFEIAKNVYLNFDFKRVDIQTDVKVAGSKLTTLKVDPNLVSIGIGWRF